MELRQWAGGARVIILFVTRDYTLRVIILFRSLLKWRTGPVLCTRQKNIKGAVSEHFLHVSTTLLAINYPCK